MPGPSMDSIKKKIMSMVGEKDQAVERADQFEARAAELEEAIKSLETDHNNLIKKISALDLEVDEKSEKLSGVTSNLDAANKQSSESELEIAGLNRRIYLITDDLTKAGERLKEFEADLESKNTQAEEIDKERKNFETLCFENDEKISKLENQVQEALTIAADSDKRFDETSRRLAIMELNLEAAEDRAETAETKCLEFEETLRTVFTNMKALEESELEALAKEEQYTTEIKEITQRLKEAEVRAENGERELNKLNSVVETLEDELAEEKEKLKEMSEQLEHALVDLQAVV